MRRVVIALLMLLALVSPALAATVVVPGLPPVVVPDPPYSGCVMHLPFDEGTGNVTYNAVNPLQNNGTLGDGVNYMPTWVPGKLGYGLYFNSSEGDYVVVPNSDSLNVGAQFTVAAWIKANNIAGSRNIIGKGQRGMGAYNYDLVISNGYASVGFMNTDGVTYFATSSSQVISAGEWYFIAGTYDGQTLTLYVNGKQVASTSASGIVTTVYSPPVLIGKSSNPNFVYFDGIIDEVYIFNRALSSEEIQLLYQRGATHRFDTNITIDLRQLNVPRLDLSGESATAEVSFDISANAAGTVWIPVPASAKILDNVEFAYGIDGKVLTIDDNRYVNASSVTVSIPISINTFTEEELPNELYLDSDSKTFEFKKSIRIVNPSDISIMATLSVDPRTIGVANAYLDGSPMSLFNGSLISSIILGPGESKVMELTATLPVTMQSLEFRATLDDFFEINSFDQAVKMAQSATEGKIETVTKVIAIDSADFKSFGNRTVIIPLDVKVSDVIEAKALTGSKELLEVREGKDGKAEIVVPATVFEGTPLGTQHAEIKVIYNKKPAWWERLPFLKSLGGFFEFLAKIFGFGR